MMLWTIDYSILATSEVKLIGQKFDGLDLLPFLNTVVILAKFQSFGIWPVVKDCLNKMQSGLTKHPAQALRT